MSKEFIKQGVVLARKAEKQLEALRQTMLLLREHSNAGANLFGGSMLNKYGITKQTDIRDNYSWMKNQITGSDLYYIGKLKEQQRLTNQKLSEIVKTKIKK